MLALFGEEGACLAGGGTSEDGLCIQTLPDLDAFRPGLGGHPWSSGSSFFIFYCISYSYNFLYDYFF